MSTICKNWTHSRCCYVTYDNFAMCLPCNHNCFPFSEISNIELLVCFLQLQKSLIQHLMKFHFHLLNLVYLTPSEINSANNMFLKLSYFHFSVRSLAKNQHKIDTFFSMCNVSPDFIAISETKLKSKVLYKYTNS